MAGDWIKMRMDLHDDPAVVAMSASLGISEDEVIGKLHRLWCWADRHTTDGKAPLIGPKWVDKYSFQPGFADSMVAVGWLEFTGDGICFPKFDRHNGESAKRRAEGALRQRLSRQNRDNGVTGEDRTPIPRPFIRHVFERDGYVCVFCGLASDAKREASRKKRLSVDHLKPSSRGGLTNIENLATCCIRCNNEKNDRTPEEWGTLPTFLAEPVSYKDGNLVTELSQESCDKSATRGQDRTEEQNNNNNEVVVGQFVSRGLTQKLATKLLSVSDPALSGKILAYFDACKGTIKNPTGALRSMLKDPEKWDFEKSQDGSWTSPLDRGKKVQNGIDARARTLALREKVRLEQEELERSQKDSNDPNRPIATA